MGIELPESRWVDLGGPVHYREWAGPRELTFVCVHGLGGSHLNWLPVAPGLAPRGRVLALDLPGFGLSPRNGRETTLQANRRLISSFARATASGRLILVGNSMGASLALLQAAFAPDSVTGVVATNPALPWSARALPAPIVLGAFVIYQIRGVGEWVVRQRLNRLSAERLVAEALRIGTADPASIDPEVVEAHVEMVRERRSVPDAIPAFLEASRSLLRLGNRPRAAREIMARIACPVLLIHGGRDRLVPVEAAVAAARERPRWRLRIFEDVGHIAQLEAPDRWLAAILEWLDDENVWGPVEAATG